jgi:hydrogenase expression/formation protein HypC
MKIKSIDYPTAIGEIEGVEREINLQFLDENDIKVGDYVMVHVGFAISKVDEEYVKQFVETVQEIERLEEDAYHKW